MFVTTGLKILNSVMKSLLIKKGITMEVSFEIEDYFDSNEIYEMVRYEAQYIIEEKVNKALRIVGISDIIFDVAYKTTLKILEEQEVDLHQKIADKTLECIDDLSLYYVLRDNDDGTKSKGQQVLDECVDEARPKIQQKVDDIIEDNLNAGWLVDEVVDAFYSKLREQLVG